MNKKYKYFEMIMMSGSLSGIWLWIISQIKIWSSNSIIVISVISINLVFLWKTCVFDERKNYDAEPTKNEVL